jgi:SAM-dependent methyltransferase
MRLTVKSTAKRALNLLGLGALVRDLRCQARYLLDAKTQHRNGRFRGQSAPDDLPMPPPKLIYLVTGQFDAEAFYQNGVIGAKCIQGVLNRHGLELSSFDKMLDFGCGCGRVLRHWRTLAGPEVYGIDYNPALIDWCRENLSFWITTSLC